MSAVFDAEHVLSADVCTYMYIHTYTSMAPQGFAACRLYDK